MQVQVLHFREVVRALNGLEVGLGHIVPGKLAAVGGGEHPLGFVIVEDERLAHEGLVDALGGFGEEALSVEGGPLGRPAGHSLPQGRRSFAI